MSYAALILSMLVILAGCGEARSEGKVTAKLQPAGALKRCTASVIPPFNSVLKLLIILGG
jgi:hypothetical protein